MKRIFIGLVTLFFSGSLYADIYSLKGGILAHGKGPLSSGREQGYDLTLEVLWEESFLLAYPGVGIEVNNSGFTNFLYTGLDWEGYFFDTIVWELFFGIAVHDGNLTPSDPKKRALGSRVLFREAIALGFDISSEMTVTLIYVHYSHSGTDESLYNQGSDNTGIRLGYYF